MTKGHYIRTSMSFGKSQNKSHFTSFRLGNTDRLVCVYFINFLIHRIFFVRYLQSMANENLFINNSLMMYEL